jgi:alkylation response protein AidB-like acyl-CoA dehydrogenase
MHDEVSRVQVGAISALSGGSVIGAPPVVNFGTLAQKQQWLPKIFTGEVRFCLGATEPTGGSDLANLKTTARKSADGRFYIVNGHKVRVWC